MTRVAVIALFLALAACAPRESAEVTTVDACTAEGERLLHVPSPDWRDQVIYMLFIDRFQDGDPANNDKGYDEYDPAKGSHFSGGDLQGVIDRVDYLKSLGVTAVWITPPVQNQWWSTPYQAAGWHGYWATNFLEIDPHFGTLEDYKRLSHELHCNGMFLIQDIVANHTANWFVYDGEYDPDDTAKNFRLLEPDSHQPAPTQPPFDMINRLDPEHAAADIYHWTPTIADFGDRHQKYNWSLGNLSDINTENPVVVDALKETYRYWIDEVGVDGYRIDTVMHVPFEFWHRFANDDDGIYAHARQAGKNHFLTFGESFSISDPFDDSGEKEVTAYLGTDSKPGLNSMLGFPLYYEINRVMAQGQPTAQLEYRLNRFMQSYEEPFVIPNFVDNHDTARFLSAGHGAAFKQALALVFTVPGIPIVYQGTEQGMVETRKAMFAGGYRNPEGSFDRDSEYYRYIRALAGVRSANPALTRGDLRVLASDSAGPGVIAYRREYEDDVVVVIMNTADHSILVHDLDAGLGPDQSLRPLFAEAINADVATDSRGRINLRLPARAIVVLQPGGDGGAVEESTSQVLEIEIERSPDGRTFGDDFELAGTVSEGGVPLQLIINGNLDDATSFAAGADGRWRVTVPVGDLGKVDNYLEVYSPEANALSRRAYYTTRVAEAAIEARATDPSDDGFGPTGNYIIPQQPESGGQREIEAIEVRAAGRNLELTLTMKEITTPWSPPNGFDNVSFTTFFSLPDGAGATDLPLINASMPDSLTWDLAHVASGWTSYSYRSNGAGAAEQGEKLGVSPQITANVGERTIRFFYEGAKLGVEDWSGTAIYVTTWNVTGEGAYDDLRPEPSQWFFGGGAADGPKIMDDILVVLGEEER